MNKVVIQLSTSILLILLSGLFGYYLNESKDEKDRQTRMLDYYVNNNIIDVEGPSDLGENLEITLNKKTIGNLSQVTVVLYNFNDRDFENIDIYLDLIPEEGDSLRIVRAEVLGANKLKETISQNQNTEPSKEKGGIRLGYLIKNANRSSLPILEAQFLVLGKVQDTQFEIDKKGISKRELEWDNYYNSPIYEKDWTETNGFLIGVSTLYILILFIITRFLNKLQSKYAKKKRSYVMRELNEKLDSLQGTTNEEMLKKEMSKLEYSYDWEHASKWKKFINGMKAPQNDGAASNQDETKSVL